jgi:hypothetical protein
MRQTIYALRQGGFRLTLDRRRRERFGKQGIEQTTADGVALREAGVELVAEGHQFVDFGDDTVLFGERRNCDGYSIHSILR